MSFLTLLRRAALTLLFILLPAASGWACTPVFVRGQATTLRLNVGQLTVPADARPGTPLYHKSFAWNRLSDGGEQWIRCADDPHGLSPLLLDSLLSGERRDRRFIKLTSPALAFAYRCALSAAMAAFLTGRRPRRLANG
jgi:hypothetical protein